VHPKKQWITMIFQKIQMDQQRLPVAVNGLKFVEDPAKRGNWKIEIWER